MAALRLNKSPVLLLFNLAICLGTMSLLPSVYRLFHANDHKVDLYTQDLGILRPTADIGMLLKVVDAQKLMEDQDHLRPLANFTMAPRIALTGNTIPVRWVAINMVKSAVRNSDRRNVIRKTWGSVNSIDGVRIETVFIVGSTEDAHLQAEIVRENLENGDILQMKTPDGYSSVPQKTLAGMQWVAENTPGSWLYSSADDDIALHPKNFVRFIDDTIRKYSSQTNSNGMMTNLLTTLPIMCIYSYNEGDPPARDPKSKWYMSPDIYPPGVWPPYCRGGWYTIPVSVVSKLHLISRKTFYIRLDDVWITGIMRIKMLASLPNATGDTLLKSGIVPAPLANRGDASLIRGDGEGDVDKVIVRHVWGNIEQHHVDVSNALTEIWNKWLPSMKKGKHGTEKLGA